MKYFSFILACSGEYCTQQNVQVIPPFLQSLPENPHQICPFKSSTLIKWYSGFFSHKFQFTKSNIVQNI